MLNPCKLQTILGDPAVGFRPAFSPDPTDCPWVSENGPEMYYLKAKFK